MIHIYRDLEELSRAAARRVIEANHAVPPDRHFSLALAGGSTPRRTYELLAQSPFREQVDWTRTHVFWGDERCVPADDYRSNERLARQALLERVPVLPSHIHPIRCVENSLLCARDYEALLRAFLGDAGRLDLVILGLGEDGHTASLKPGTKALKERQAWTSTVRAAGEDFDRVTLTLPVLNAARTVVFLVSGTAKARVLRQVLEEPKPQRYPAGLVHPTDGELCWLVDQAAGAQLSTDLTRGHAGALR